MKDLSTIGIANNLVNFGVAVAAMKDGKRVARKGWNGKGMFIFMQVPSVVPIEFVPKMSSLPKSVKVEFEKRLKHNAEQGNSLSGQSISYQNQIAMVYPDNSIYGWVASPSDVLEEDWVVLD